MHVSEDIIVQIKMLCTSVTKGTYDIRIQQGYELLVKLHDLGVDKESVYQSLLQYHNGLEDSLSREFAADMLDFIVGWCSPQYNIWENE